MKKVLFTLATLFAFGATANAQLPAPVLAFGTDANNLITEIELAPGETSEEIHVVLVEQQEVVVQGFQMQWLMKDATGELTETVNCPMIYGGRVKTWTNAENISTANEAVGGTIGNSLASSHPLFATWRWVGTNTSSNQFWWNTDYDGNPTAPVCVGCFKIEVPADWADEFVTFELDKEYTIYNQTADETPASTQGYEARPDYDMVLTVKNKNFVPPVIDEPLTGEIILGEVDAENGLLPVSYNGDEDVTITVTVNGEVVEIVDGNVQLAEGDNTVVVTVTAEGYLPLEKTETVNWTKPQPPVQTPAPTINITPGDEAYIIEAVGEGTVTLFINNEEVENPYTINRTDADQVITVTAVAHVDGQIDGTVTGEYMIPALEVLPPVVTPAPEISYEVTDEAVIITATGEGEVLLYVNGELVDNPCTIDRGATDVVVVVTATAQGEDMEISEVASMEITIPAIGETPEDPHMTGYWIVLIDENDNEVWYPLNEDPDDNNWYIMKTLHHQPWNLDVPFYFMVNGVRYGSETDMQLPAMGDAEQTILNPVFESENFWYVPAGYTYTWGLQFVDGEIYLLVSQGKMTGIDEIVDGKTVANVRYFNMAGQEMQEANGMTIVVTTYTDGTTNAVKVIK